MKQMLTQVRRDKIGHVASTAVIVLLLSRDVSRLLVIRFANVIAHKNKAYEKPKKNP